MAFLSHIQGLVTGLGRPLVVSFLCLTGTFVHAHAQTASAQMALEAKNICLNKEARDQMSQKNFFKPLNEIKTLVADTKLILMGELHYDMPGSRAKILKFLKSSMPEKTCFFYELNSSKTIEQHLRDQAKDPAYDLPYQEFKEIHQAAQKLQFTELTVDSDNMRDYDTHSLNLRNQAMADNIQAAFDRGVCERGLMLVGKDHLAISSNADRPLQSLLPEQIKTLTINLVNSSEKDGFSTIPELSSWKRVCPRGKSLPLFKDMRFFASKNLPKSLVMNPLGPDLTNFWSEFDLTILFP